MSHTKSKRNGNRPGWSCCLLPIISLILAPGEVAVHAGDADTALRRPAGDAVRSSLSCAAPLTIRINEVGPVGAAPGQQWVELLNWGDSPLSLANAVFTDHDGNEYPIPESLPPVPAGGFVVIVFDGGGAAMDDYDFGDNVAILHSEAGLIDPFERIDEAALYVSSDFSPDTILSFVAWGDMPDPADANNAVAAGLWGEGAFVIPDDPGFGLYSPIAENESIGVYPRDQSSPPFDWVLYRVALTTPGEENESPTPEFRSPLDEAITPDLGTPYSWSEVPGAIDYTLEIDDDPLFGSPEIAVTLGSSIFVPDPAPALGTYFARVKAGLAGGAESRFSETISVTYEAEGRERGGPRADLGVVELLQRKDTGMLCLQGCNPLGGDLRWDGLHANCDNGARNTGSCNVHDNMYCVRASIAMVVNYRNAQAGVGGTLSQDRISYAEYGGGEPDDDLCHGCGMFPNRLATRGAGNNTFTWAMNGGAVLSFNGSPTYAQIQAWINNDQPILVCTRKPSHAWVISGFEAPNRVVVIDPWTGARTRWDYTLGVRNNIQEYHVAPVQAGRVDEASVAADSDGDGVVDFDETTRFGTNPNIADTDGDGVNDKAEILSYSVRFPWFRRQIIHADGDGLRPERDPDSDNGGLLDGQEDRNGNGIYQPFAALRETDPYNFFDDGPQVLDLVFCIDVTGSMADDILAVRNAALNLLNFVNARTAGWRVAIVVYRDFPILPFGQPGDFPFAVVLPFTGNINAAVAGINALPALVGQGGNIPESVYFAVTRTILNNGAAIGGFRGAPVKKIMVVMGDAPPHDPEPFTGLTRAAVVNIARQAGIALAQRERGGDFTDNPVAFYNLVIGSDANAQAAFESLASETGGAYFEAATDADVVGTIEGVMERADESPIADGGGPYIGTVGVPITFDASRSLDAESCIVAYGWDWDGDFVLDDVSPDPIIEHTFSAADCPLVLLVVTDADGNTAYDVVPVAIDPAGQDCNGDGIPDDCEQDCNENGVPDACEIAGGTVQDCDDNGVPDECERDCNNNGIADVCEILSDAAEDCNLNTVPDACDIATGTSQDCNQNGVPDECDPIDAFLGDMNCDCMVTVGDIPGFVQALVDPAAYTTTNPTCNVMRADMNGDGVISPGDIAGFVARLTGP